MNSKLSRWCDGIIEAGWLAAVIITPLFFNTHSDRVFEPDKLTLLRSIALLVAVVWLVKFVDQRQWQELGRWLTPRRNDTIWQMPFVLPVALLLLVYLLSTLFSVTPAISWAGSYQRLQGTYTTLSYLVLFGVTIHTMRTRAQARRLITAVIISSIPVAFYGLLQHFNLDPLPWAGSTQERVAGHMGNAIFIAAYLIMAVPLTLSRIIVSFNNILTDEQLSTADVIRSSIYIFTLAIQLITIYWSGSRGPWIGLFVGLFAFVLIVLVALRNAVTGAENGRFQAADAGKALLLVVVGGSVAFAIASFAIQALLNSGRAQTLAGSMASFVSFVLAVGVVVLIIFVLIAAQRGWRWLWLSWMVLSLFLGVWLVAFNLPAVTESVADAPVIGTVANTLDEWRELPRIGRLGSVLESDSGTGRVRALIWEGVLELITPHEPLRFPDGEQDPFNWLRPVLGYGPEAMYVAYNRFYPPELATVEARNASPDRSHNETFDALVITGWAGLLAWQFLYLSIFTYAFRWLGILRGTFDRNLLIGLWFGVGILVAILFAVLLDPVYVGVAFPFGSIFGLILYLIYFALVGRGTLDEATKRPFAADRMLMVALVAAILAHYVEIHFGIAIASTRTHFFLYAAALFVIGHVIPQLRPAEATVGDVAETAVEPPAPKSTGRKRRRGRGRPTGRSARSSQGGIFTGPTMLAFFILTMVVSILGFQFITYSQPPGRDYNSILDLPVAEVINQSFFIDASRNFADSPFVFIMIVLTWALGSLLIVSEMIKDGELKLDRYATLADRQRLWLTAVLGFVGLVALGSRFLLPIPATAGTTFFLGRTLLLMLGAGFLITAVLVYTQNESAQLSAAIVGLVTALGGLPVMLAGGWWQGLLLIVLGGWVLFTALHPNWQQPLLGTAVMAGGAFAISLFYIYLHATVFRNSLFVTPPNIETVEQLANFRISEASQAAIYLTVFYLFTFTILLISGTLAALPRMGTTREGGHAYGYASLVVVTVLLFWLIPVTNLRIIQADMIFKRGRFFDAQASGSGAPELWDSAIAIYQRTIELAPREDYYYLFLGRAYLERAGLATSEAEQQALFEEAQDRLLEAQTINPLNTDHTANLARLNTRLIPSAQDELVLNQRLSRAEGYYQDALSLSPQNSIIRNEYARLAFDVKQDCEQAIGLFEESLETDPYFTETYFWLVDTYYRCSLNVDEETAETYLNDSVEVLQAGLDRDPDNTRAWLRAVQIYQDLGLAAEADAALEQLRQLDPSQQTLAEWNYLLQKGRIANLAGDAAAAATFAREALTVSPAPEVSQQIELFLQEVDPTFVPTPPEATPAEPETAVPETTITPATDFVLLEGERPLATLPPAERNDFYDAYPDLVIDLNKTYEALITTEDGVMRFRLFTQDAPLAVNNFVFLATQGFYDGTTFHRVIEEFMAQGGDPTGTGSGGPGYAFDDEVENGRLFNQDGLLAMANAGPATNGSQFFITLAPTPWLDGNHTIFGQLIEGNAVLRSITLRDPATADFEGDGIQRIDILEVTE